MPVGTIWHRMARTTISLHEAKVFHLLKTNKDKWLSHGEIADALKPISDRTVRAHVLRLTRLDQAVALFGLPA